MKLSTNKAPKIKLTKTMLKEAAQKYQDLKEATAELAKEMKQVEAILKSPDNDFNEIDTTTKILVISMNKAPDKFELDLFKADHPKLKWNDAKYITKKPDIKKLTFKKKD